MGATVACLCYSKTDAYAIVGAAVEVGSFQGDVDSFLGFFVPLDMCSSKQCTVCLAWPHPHTLQMVCTDWNNLMTKHLSVQVDNLEQIETCIEFR